MKRNIPPLPPETSPIWRDIVTGNREFNFKFLAAKILLMRVKMNIRMNPDRNDVINDGIWQLRNLYLKRGYLPDAREDLKNIFGVE